jgi:UDP-N-acetyl-D-glucosamine dehydrogenase
MGFEELISSKKAKVGIIGLGYVGLPLACTIAKAGFNVIGFDKSKEKVESVSRGLSTINDVSSELLRDFTEKGKLFATQDFGLLKEIDVVCICVPTPLSPYKEPDLSYVESATDEVAKKLNGQKLIILESTTYPGTTREKVLSKLKEKGRVGEDFFLAYSPERVDPGNKKYTIENTPKVVGGVTPRCTELATLFYSQFVKDVFPVSSPESAEMTKLLENIFRVVNIALVNELMMLCDRMGINIWEVIEAASTKPFGFMPFYPGPGIGGHCIPIDPFYLSWKAKAYNFPTEFIELAGKINERMPYYVVEKASEYLNKAGKSIKDSGILIVGVAYKKDISDTRESPALKIIELLLEKGGKVSYHDPYVPEIKVSGKNLESKSVSREVLKSFDLVMIITDHSNVDYELIKNESNLILDMRNKLRREKS